MAGTYTVVVTAGGSSTTSNPATLIVTALNGPGTYFGTFAGNAGTLSLVVAADGKGTFLGYVSNPRAAIVAGVLVAADGTFSALTASVQPRASGAPTPALSFTLAGRIAAGGAVTGTLSGGLSLAYTGALDPGGAAAPAGGLYRAVNDGATTGTTTYVVVGGSGRVGVLTIGATLVSGGQASSAIMGSGGAFTSTTPDNATIAGTIEAPSAANPFGGLTATITTGTGPAVTVTGFGIGQPSAPTRLSNLSILTDIPAAGDNFTLGYVVGGADTTGAKPLLLRAAGPSLGALGVPGTIADPQLELFTGATRTGANDNWGGTAALAAAMQAAGAFPYVNATSRDAAMLASITTRDNSVRVSGVGNVTGAVIAEVYDTTPEAAFTATTPRLVNVSVLKRVRAGFTVGFVVAGRTTRTVLIRAVGPGLAGVGVPSGFVADPRLTLFAGTAQIDQNDNWVSSATLTAATTQVGAFALPAASRDAALLATLQPGNYSVQAAAVGTGAAANGLVIVEVYEVP